jgi:hypothetical protein
MLTVHGLNLGNDQNTETHCATLERHCAAHGMEDPDGPRFERYGPVSPG